MMPRPPQSILFVGILLIDPVAFCKIDNKGLIRAVDGDHIEPEGTRRTRSNHLNPHGDRVTLYTAVSGGCTPKCGEEQPAL
jgi:hypothetical protein